MQASEMTFGIEIETLAPASAIRDGLQIGSYHHGLQVPYLPEGWKAERDGSLRPGANEYACEIVSPVLKGIEGLRQVAEVIAILVAKGHRVNASCGLHVHVGWAYDTDSSKMARLLTITSYAEKALYASAGTKSREQGANGTCYCNGIKKYGTPAQAKKNCEGFRYHTLNLTNLANRTRPTVEFRVFSGSLNATKVLGWVQLALGIVEQAHHAKRSPSWNPQPLKAGGGWAKGGPGRSELERLMGYLGWGEGYAKRLGGRMAGWLLPRNEMDGVKAELRRLADKYDAEGTEPSTQVA